MKATKIVFLVGGIAVGLSAALTATSCTPVDDSEEAGVPADQSTGIPNEVADEIEPLNKRLESEALSEAGLRVKGEEKDAETFATQSTGIPEEVAEEVDAISKRLMRDSLSEAGLRVKGITEEGTVSATQSTGIPDEVAEEVNAITERLEADALSEAGSPLHEKFIVYAKIVLPGKAPAKGELPVESWIARRLQKLGEQEIRAVTGWVRLPKGAERGATIWNGVLDGKGTGCIVDGYVGELAADGNVHVTLSGWAPFPPKIDGDSLPAEIGSRQMAVVDTGRADGVKSYVALMIAPALQTNGAGIQDGARQPVSQIALSQRAFSKGTWSYKDGKPESVTFDYGTELTVEDIDRLSGFGSIARITMGYAGIDSEYVTIEGDLLKLGQLKNLREVHLCKDGIDDNDLRFVALLPKIHTLEFNANNGSDDASICTDACADHLSAAKTLRKLVIHDGQFSDKFVATITKELSGLEELWLNSPDLTDKSLRLLAERCKELKTLRIASAHFTAEGLKQLDSLKYLKDRSVSSPALRKEGR